jgi:hypothetical protein
MMLWKGLSKQLGVPLVSLPEHAFPPGVERLIPLELCRKHSLVPLGRDERGVSVATSEPNNIAGIDDVTFHVGARLRVLLATDREVEWAVRRLYHGDLSPCPPPKLRRVVAEPDPGPVITQGFSNGAPAVQPLGRSSSTPIAELAAAAAWVPSTAPVPTAPSIPPMAMPGASGLPAPFGGQAPGSFPPWPAEPSSEAAIRETAQALRVVVESCIQRGIFTREEYLARLRAQG